MSTQEIGEQRRQLPEEEPIQIGPVRANFRLGWASLTLLSSLLMVIFANALNQLLVGVVYTVLAISCYVIYVGMPSPKRGYNALLPAVFRSQSNKWYKRLGWSKFRSADAQTGVIFGAEPMGKQPRRSRDKHIGGVEFRPYDVIPEQNIPKGGQLAVGVDKLYGTLSGTMWAAGVPLIGADPERREALLDAYARVLDLFADPQSPAYRLKWQERTLDSEPQHPTRQANIIRKDAMLVDKPQPNFDVVQQRTVEMGKLSKPNLTTITLSVRRKDIRHEAKKLGSAEQVLVSQLNMLYSAAMGEGYKGLGLRSAQFFPYNEMIVHCRNLLDPVFTREYADAGLGSDIAKAMNAEFAFPGFCDWEHDDYCRIGDTWHMGFYLEPPSMTGVVPEQFWEIQRVPISKTITTIVQMIPAGRAQSRAEYATTGASGHNIDTANAQRRVTEKDRLAAEEAIRQEREIVRATGQVGRMRTYYDVTGSSEKDVTERARLLQSAAVKNRLILEPLTGRQFQGIEALLPVGRGLSALSLPDWLYI